MFCKMCKKCFCMFLFAALMGIGLYVAGCLKGKNMDDELADEIREKKARMKEACGKVKDRTMEIARELKEDVREDIEDCADAIFEDGEHA